MITHGALGKRSADVTRRILTPVANDNDCLNFIIENREYFKKIINAAEDDASDFKDIIRQKVELNVYYILWHAKLP